MKKIKVQINKLKEKTSSFYNDFKKFISRGNIVDMAVGVIIGTAFSAIVTALTNKIIMPFINLLLSIGGTNGLENAYTFLRKVYDTSGQLDLTKSIYIDWGAFITAIINFFLIAFVLFTLLRIMMRAKGVAKEINEANTKSARQERKEIRKQAKAENRPFKEVWAEHKAKQEEELKRKKEEAEKNKPVIETQEDILKDIRNLLKAQQSNINISQDSETSTTNEN